MAARVSPPRIMGHATTTSKPHDAELAADVKVTATTTKPITPDTHLVGVEDDMTGLIAFAQAVEPDTRREIASFGEKRNALRMITVEAGFGGDPVTLPGRASSCSMTTTGFRSNRSSSSFATDPAPGAAALTRGYGAVS